MSKHAFNLDLSRKYHFSFQSCMLLKKESAATRSNFWTPLGSVFLNSLSSAFDTNPSLSFSSSIFCWWIGDNVTGSLVGRDLSWVWRLGLEALERSKRSCLLKVGEVGSAATGVGGVEEWTCKRKSEINVV